MNSPELLLLVENCPKGAETLVTRCLHSLTDKGAGALPSTFCPTRCSPAGARAAASLVPVPLWVLLTSLCSENHMGCI